MSGPRSPMHRPMGRLATAAMWIALLGGILAMHGLGSHGTGADSMAAPAAAGAHLDHAAPMADDHPPTGDHTDMIAACMAILVATTCLLAVRLRHRWWPRGWHVTLRLATGFVPRPGITNPPPLAHFSVMRC